MLNIVIPMAGWGSRFSKAGYTLPKPLIPIHGKAMIQTVIMNLKPKQDHRFIFVCLEEHTKKYDLKNKLEIWAPGCKIATTDGVTEGAACTVLLAADFIDNDDQLMIANSDQWVDVNINTYLSSMDKKGLDGLIMTMWADDPKWSFIRFGKTGEIMEVVEKQVVSNEATVGVYNFRSGKDFCKAARKMIADNIRVNNEFYVAPVYNEMIKASAKLEIYNIGKVDNGMYGLGTPDDLERFLKMPVSNKAVDFGVR